MSTSSSLNQKAKRDLKQAIDELTRSLDRQKASEERFQLAVEMSRKINNEKRPPRFKTTDEANEWLVKRAAIQ